MSTVPYAADTSLESARVQNAVYRRMTPEQRLLLALQMSESVRALAASGVRIRHPEYSEIQVRLAVNRLLLGEEWFRRVYPGEDVAP